MIRLLVFGLLFIVGCESSNKKESQQDNKVKDDILTGFLGLAVDESLVPLLNQQISVFRESYPNTNIVLQSAPEISAVNMLLENKAQMAVLTRELSVQENEYFTKRGIQPRIFKIGYDGIVLVNSKNSRDTSIQISKIIDLMKSATKDNASLVFDNVNSSAVRMLKEIGQFQKVSASNVVIEDSLFSLIGKVIDDPSSIGIMSLNQYLNAKQTFAEIDKIRILSVRSDVGENKSDLYYKPSQTSLSTGEYALRRPIYILNYQPNTGLGLGFSAFLTGDRGQRILLKSGLLPETMPGRELIIRDNIN